MGRPSTAELAEFNALLASAVERGIPLERATGIIASQARAGAFRAAIEAAARSLREGESLPEALRRRPKIFSAEYCALVESGLQSNRLAEVLRHSESHLRLYTRLRRGFRGLAVYLGTGFILCTIALIVLSAIALRFSGIWETFQIKKLPWLTETVIWIAGHLSVVTPVLVGAILLFAAAYVFFSKCVSSTKFGYLLPVWGRLQKSRDWGLFCTVMAIRSSTSTSMSECLESAAKAVPNRHARRIIERARKRIDEGEDLPTALFYVGFFPRTLTWALSMGAKRGDVPGIFRTFAQLYSAELERSFEILFTILTPLGILALGNVVFLAVMVMFLPMTKIIGWLV